MKTIATVLFTLSISFSLLAQSPWRLMSTNGGDYTSVTDSSSYDYNQSNTVTICNFKKTNGQWEKSSITRETYRSDGLILTRELTPSSGNSWQVAYRDTWQYNNNNKTTEYRRQTMVNGVWSITDQYIYTYNSNAELDTFTRYRLVRGTLMPVEQKVYTHNSQSQIDTTWLYNYSADSNSFYYNAFTVNSYDVEGRVVQEYTLFPFSDFDTTYQIISRSYNLDGQLVSVYRTTSGWDMGDLEEYNSGTSYEYGSHGNLSKRIEQGAFEVGAGQNPFWGPPEWIVNYFYKLSTSVEVLSDNSRIRLFPNPTSGKVSVTTNRTAELYIFDLIGKEVYHTQLVSGDNQISLPETATIESIYIYKVIAKGEVLVMDKLIIGQ